MEETYKPIPNYEGLYEVSNLGNPENKKCVNHIDSNRTNNNLSNLEWVTYGENMQHALKSGSFKNQPKGEDHCCNKLSFNAIKLIRCLKNKALNETIARLFNVSHSHISNILNDKSRIHC